MTVHLVDYPLTDLLEHVVDNRGRTCPTASEGFPLIATNCLRRGQRSVVFENLRYVDEKTYREWFRSHLEPRDILFVCKGTPGRLAVVPDPVPYCIAQDMVGLRARPSVVDAGYLYYRLLSPDVQSSITSMHVGTMIPHFKRGDFNKLRFPIHNDTGEQRAIAEVLGALDDKVAVNVAIVDRIDGLVRARFEGIKGPPVRLNMLGENVRRQVAPDQIDPSTNYIGLEHIPRRRLLVSENGAAEKVASAKTSFESGDTLFGKLRPNFHKVAWAHFEGICSTDVLVLRAKEPDLRGFMLAAASADRTVASVSSAVQGTKMPRTNWSDLGAVEVPWPGEERARAFSRETESLAQFGGCLNDESRKIAATRDELLPLLMSGKIQVKDAEKVVEGDP